MNNMQNVFYVINYWMEVADVLWGESQVPCNHLLFLAKHLYRFSEGGQSI